MQELQRPTSGAPAAAETTTAKKKQITRRFPNRPRVEQFRYLTLRRGIRYEQDWISWCDEVLEFLQEKGKVG